MEKTIEIIKDWDEDYKKIKLANDEMTLTPIGRKNYATVNERVKAFRKVYPKGSIETDIEEIKDDYVRMKTTVLDEEDNIIATGRASEVKIGNINKMSMIENCETSAVGRALGFAGFGIEASIASGEDIKSNKENLKQFEIFNNLFISESDAISIIKSSINELIRKFGIVKASLESKINETLWTNLSELNIQQFQKLETKLKTVNMETNDWHELYNENIKIKEVVPVGQEVAYESSWYKFGMLALKMAKDNQAQRDEIIDFYLSIGINLEN